MTELHAFDDRRARTYRKRAEVLAFRSDDGFVFHKGWGEQALRPGSWLLVPLADDGTPTRDLYGCDAEVFAATYEPSPSLRRNRYRKTETVRAYQPGHPFATDTVLSDGHTEVEGSRSEAYDGWIVRAPDGEDYPVEDAEFRRTYVEVQERSEAYRVRTRDEHWTADGTPKRILALDGGGVRGALTLGYLERIEGVLRARHGGADDFRLSHYFDLIAGTSTGAIIAACLAKGMAVRDVRELYDRLAGGVFARSWLRRGVLRAKYSARMLKTNLQAVFRDNTLGSSALQTGLLVVAKRLDTGSTWPMANNPGNRFFTAAPGDPFFSNEDYLLRKVVRASTAAPSYFVPEAIRISDEGDRPHGDFVDGGMSPHNNPALLALLLVAAEGFGARWPLDPDKLMIVSVGTGSATPGVVHSRFALPHAVTSLLSLMDDCAEFVETMLQWLSSSPTARPIDAALDDLGPDLLAERPLFHYLRYNVQFDAGWLERELDTVLDERTVAALRAMDRPANLPMLAKLGDRAAARQVEEDHFPAAFDLG